MVLVFLLSDIEKKAELDAARAEKAKQINNQVNNLIHDMAEIASITDVGGEMGGGADTIIALREGVKSIRHDFKELEKAAAGEPGKLAIITNAEQATIQSGQIFKELLSANISSSINREEKKVLWHRLRAAIRASMSKQLIDLNEYEQSVSNEGPKAQAELRQRTRDLLTGYAVFDLSFALIIFLFIAFQIKKRLDRLVQNTTLLAMGRELLPHIKGSDELSVLDESFHAMADLLNEASRKERAATENAVDMICSINKNLQIIAANPAAEKILDCPLSEIIGRRLSDFIERDSWPEMEKAIT